MSRAGHYRCPGLPDLSLQHDLHLKTCTAFSTARHDSAAAKDLIPTMLGQFHEIWCVRRYDVIWNLKG